MAISGKRHWRTRQDPLEAVWLSDMLPLLASRPQISPTTVLEYLQDKYPGQYPDKVRRTLQRCADYEELSVRVSSSSIINVRHVVYSVPSRLIGQMLKVRQWDDRLSCYVGSDEVMSC